MLRHTSFCGAEVARIAGDQSYDPKSPDACGRCAYSLSTIEEANAP